MLMSIQNPQSILYWGICFISFLLFSILNLVQANSQSGYFETMWGDPPPDSGLNSRVEYKLFGKQGQLNSLQLDESLIQQNGGHFAVNRQQVKVEGFASALSPTSNQEIINVQSLSLIESSSKEEDFREERLKRKISGSQSWVTILCRFSDSVSETPHGTDYYEQLMMGTISPRLDRV
jgi:hypothetical protein